MPSRTVCVVTGSRAEFGLLRILMDAIAADPALELRSIVTGSHLSNAFGSTVDEVRASGHRIDREVRCLPPDDPEPDIADAFAKALVGLRDALDDLHPDVVVLLGDRFEMLAAAVAATFCRIPIAHLHGGETTEGAFDEGMRHAITKLSHLHFVAHEDYRVRVLQLGESAERVWNFGALGAEAAIGTPVATQAELAIALGREVPDRVLLVTVHPATLDPTQDAPTIDAVIEALDEEQEPLIVFTLPNSDPNTNVIRDRILRFVERRNNAVCVASLGQALYLSLARRAEAIVGNSSSGILEGPTLGTPTIDVGDRQRGRIRAESVLSCPPDPGAIRSALLKARSQPFLEKVSRMRPPFGNGGTSRRIVETLREVPLEGILLKQFERYPGAMSAEGAERTDEVPRDLESRRTEGGFP